MTTRSEAEEHLRVIRSLMERSTIYRAISAPVALIGGVATLLGCAFLTTKSAVPAEDHTTNHFFLATWIGVLAVTILSNTYFLWHDASRRGDKFLSPGLRMALRALLPSCLVAIIFTVLLAELSFFLPFGWMLFYGLSLLATQHFAPRSIILLGWAFLLSAIVSILSLYYSGYVTAENVWSVANITMGTTFGLYHLIYAACTWPRKNAGTISGDEP